MWKTLYVYISWERICPKFISKADYDTDFSLCKMGLLKSVLNVKPYFFVLSFTDWSSDFSISAKSLIMKRGLIHSPTSQAQKKNNRHVVTDGTQRLKVTLLNINPFAFLFWLEAPATWLVELCVPLKLVPRPRETWSPEMEDGTVFSSAFVLTISKRKKLRRCEDVLIAGHWHVPSTNKISHRSR